MSEARPQEHRYSKLFTWGGLLVAILGLALVAIGRHYLGIALVAAGIIFWLITKRRSRKAHEAPHI